MVQCSGAARSTAVIRPRSSNAKRGPTIQECHGVDTRLFLPPLFTQVEEEFCEVRQDESPITSSHRLRIKCSLG
jgi:hypothetical protein